MRAYELSFYNNIFRLLFLTCPAVDNDTIKTTPMQRIISSVDSNVGPRASIQRTSALLINKTLAFHFNSQIFCKIKIVVTFGFSFVLNSLRNI